MWYKRTTGDYEKVLPAIESVRKEFFQVIGKGINHTCNNANKKRNLELVVLGSNEATRESIASTVIKQKGSPKGEALLLHTGGNKLRVSPGTSNSKVNSYFTANNWS